MMDFRPKMRQADGAPLFAPQGKYGKEVIYATHNLCDPTTWYSDSARVTAQALTKNGANWESGNPNWIDMEHGKVFDEEGLIEDQQIFNPGDPHGYAIVVTVDGVEKTAREPFAASGGDYTVDYTLGTIAPVSENWTGKTVLASYSHASGSGWVVKPLPGKALIIDYAEVQFSTDIQMNDTFVMDVYGNVENFSPTDWDQVAPSATLWYPSGVGDPTADPAVVGEGALYYDSDAPQLHVVADVGGGTLAWVPVPPGAAPGGYSVRIEGTNYKTIDQIIDEAVLSYPQIPVLGGPRGYTQPRQVFAFRYNALRSIWSSLGMCIRISMNNDAAFTGERSTATFYCLSKADPGAETAMKLLTAE
jgi:hypothetical protein